MKSMEEIIFLFESSDSMKLIALIFIFNILIVLIGMIIDFAHRIFTTENNKNKPRNWKDSMANVAIFVFSQFLETTAFGSILFLGLYPIYSIIPFEIPTTWWTWIASMLAADFSYYWMHRLEHEHRFLWASHSVHHSSQDYNLSVSLRLSVVEGAIEWVFLIPMILMGFSLFQTVVSLILVAQYQTWIHTESIGKLGWFDGIFNTPSSHRVHHGSNSQYIDKNYGGILILWDRLFNTYQKEDETVIYGLTQNINSNNPITINFKEYLNIYQDLKQCNNFRDAFRITFGRLAWKPDYFSNRGK